MKRPSAESTGRPQGALAGSPAALTLASVVTPIARSRRNTFSTPPVVCGARLVAALTNATRPPSAEIAGSTLPFPRTATEREASQDPRPSIAERYPTQDAYVKRVEAAARKLVSDRYLLEEDVGPIVRDAARRYIELAG
ncbi:MAG: hypothetical protein IIB12_08955 [Chloroflexi bacterium]|nr:hypothetical protein [Chloroflexota bacterium]